MVTLTEIVDYSEFIASKAFDFFYNQAFSKKLNKKYLKSYIKHALKLWYLQLATVDISFDSKSFVAPSINVNLKEFDELIYLFALDLEQYSKSLVLYEPFNVMRLAEIVDKVTEDRSKGLADIYNMILPHQFLVVFDNKKKHNLHKFMPAFSVDLYAALMQVTFNLSNAMSIVGEINKKYWDDSYLELSIAGFVLEIYIYVINKFLNLKNFQMVLGYFADAELIDLLDMRSSTDLSIKFSKNKFKTSLLYSKLRQTQQILDTIKNEYEKQVQQIIK